MTGATAPIEYWYARLCQEFPAVRPDMAPHMPLPLCRDMLEYVSYAEAKADIEQASREKRAIEDPSPAHRKVMVIHSEAMKVRRSGGNH